MARKKAARPPTPDDCPDRDNHTPDQPRGYLQWHAWAEEMAKTHEQVRCPTCGLFAIWVPKENR